MTFSLLALGFLLGLRHALDADHLIAVATIVSEKKNVASSSLAGVLWGIGHTAALLLAGTLILALGISVPERLGQAVEFAVALMLVGMGIRVLFKVSLGGTLHVHAHHHGSFVHSHPHLHDKIENRDPEQTHSHSLARILGRNRVGRSASLFVGIVHGLAGSAGLMLIVAATIPDFWTGIIYIVVFGVGSIGGMLIMSMLVSIPFLMTGKISRRANVYVRAFVGFTSLTFGLFMAWDIGYAAGLFR